LILTEILGYIAGALVTCSLIPQLVRVIHLRSAREISTIFTVMLLTGVIFWLVYGVLLELVPVIIWNAIGAAVVSLLLYAKIKYGR